MGFREHRRAITLIVFLLAFPIARAEGFQGNAVLGSVYSTDDKPLENVSVTLVQDRSVRDTSRREDGIYALQVPASMKRFDLIFEHPNYLKAVDQGIDNKNPPIKRPVVFMTPKSLSYIISLPEHELDKIIAASTEAKRRGAQEGLKALFDAGTANLEDLLQAARAYRQSANYIFRQVEPDAARAAASNKQTGMGKSRKEYLQDADLLLKRAVAIQERVLGPDSAEVAGTLEMYAAVLREQGQEKEAENIARRAHTIRMRNDVRAAPASPPR